MSVPGLRLVADGLPRPHGVLGMPPLPPAREFLTSAGFGGAAALAAAVILALIAMFAARRASKRHQTQLDQQERHHQEIREDERRAAAVQRCWQRLVWVVETAGVEPAASENATLGLGPELALELLRGLLHDAEQLGDETLARSVTVYLNQLSLVLAQQSGSLADLAAAGSHATAKMDNQSRQQVPTPTAPPAANEPHNAGSADGGRRWRR
ncbi:hypothetical protein [Mycobacterium riyadhense]|nr:hypothetical protein [Mycobacterium riyadhense]